MSAIESVRECIHIKRGELAATATVTYALDVDGPVVHSLEPVSMRLCPGCAGWLLGTMGRLEQAGPLSKEWEP